MVVAVWYSYVSPEANGGGMVHLYVQQAPSSARKITCKRVLLHISGAGVNVIIGLPLPTGSFFSLVGMLQGHHVILSMSWSRRRNTRLRAQQRQHQQLAIWALRVSHICLVSRINRQLLTDRSWLSSSRNFGLFIKCREIYHVPGSVLRILVGTKKKRKLLLNITGGHSK